MRRILLAVLLSACPAQVIDTSDSGTGGGGQAGGSAGGAAGGSSAQGGGASGGQGGGAAAAGGGSSSSGGGAVSAGGGSASAGGGSGGGGASPKVPVFIAQGMVGRTTVSCDDGNTWVGNHSWDIDGDPLMCSMVQNVTCFQGMASYEDTTNNVCVQLVPCNDTPDIPAGMALGNGTFVGAWGHGFYPGALRTTTDGVAWTTRHQSDSFAIAYGSGRFVAAGNPDTYWSTDGTTWTQGGSAGFNTMGSPVRAMGYGEYDGGGRFVAVSAGNGRDIQVSSDGAQTWWRPSMIPAACASGSIGAGGGDVLSGNGVILIVDQDGNACRSVDGAQTWTVTSVGLTYVPTNGVFYNGKFTYWGNNSPGSAADDTDMITSPDGVTWTKTPMVTSTRIGPVGVSDTGTFVAVDYVWNGYAQEQFLRSTDGTSWQALPGTAFLPSHPIFRMIWGLADTSTVCP
jgi:hypothetical protein